MHLPNRSAIVMVEAKWTLLYSLLHNRIPTVLTSNFIYHRSRMSFPLLIVVLVYLHVQQEKSHV